MKPMVGVLYAFTISEGLGGLGQVYIYTYTFIYIEGGNSHFLVFWGGTCGKWESTEVCSQSVGKITINAVSRSFRVLRP